MDINELKDYRLVIAYEIYKQMRKTLIPKEWNELGRKERREFSVRADKIISAVDRANERTA